MRGLSSYLSLGPACPAESSECAVYMDALLQDVRQEAWGGMIPTELSMDSSEVTSLQRPLPLYVSSCETHLPQLRVATGGVLFPPT